MFKDHLNKMESKLRALVEGSAARLFPARDLPQRIREHLQAAMQSGIRANAAQDKIAPNLYTVSIHPAHYQDLQQHPDLLEEMAWDLEKNARETGYQFFSPPVVRLIEDTSALPHQIQVSAHISIDDLADTSDMLVEEAAGLTHLPENAFLVVDGMHIHPLNLAVINIGRRADNDIVIPDSRVSRVHAQLRAANGHYLIFDLESSGGTYVNDQLVTQSVLYPGDVISLAGLPLVYGEESSRLGHTQKFLQGPEK